MNRRDLKNLPLVTVSLIVINAVIFFIMELGSESFSTRLTYDYAMVWPAITANRQWYRLITACFLHFGFEHVASNMFMLALMGDRLEKTVGRLYFALVYLLAGVGGTAASLLFHMWRNQPVVSAGASGALYGIVGALFGYLVIRGGVADGIGKRQLVVMILFMIYSSTVGDSIDIAAHVGGLVTGVLLGLFFALVKRQKQRRTWPY